VDISDSENCGDARIAAVIDFWLGFDQSEPDAFRLGTKRWFSSDAALDKDIKRRFGTLHELAAAGSLTAWKKTPVGRLALIIVMDQFSRNLYRGTARAFAQDDTALALAIDGIDQNVDKQLEPLARVFFSMPMQHSESLKIQERGVVIFEQLANIRAPKQVSESLRGFAKFARLHRDIVAQFGRFPHRNAMLGRSMTAAETSFLSAGGPTFGQYQAS